MSSDFSDPTRWLWSFVPLAGFLACVQTVLAPTSFPAQYISQGGSFDAVPACAQYRNLAVGDLRPEKSVVGFRFSESNPSARHSISLRGDLGVPLSSAAQSAFQRVALNHSDASKVDINLRVVLIQIEEKTSLNSTYSIDVVLDVQALAGGTDQVLWSTRKSGHAWNYGQAGTELNYQETLSKGLEDALAKLLGDAEFSRALCQSSAGVPAAAVPTAPAPGPAQ
jgi:hypothetical protein